MPRTAIAILGAVNAGKSVLMNLVTQSDTSLVHATRGTTADPKACVMELHGRIGPVRLWDTPGIDESGELGTLKKARALATVGQSDVAVIVADPFASGSSGACAAAAGGRQPQQPQQGEHGNNAYSVAELLHQVQVRQRMNAEIDNNNDSTTADSAPPRGPVPPKASSLQQHPIPLLVLNLRQSKVNELERRGGSVAALLDEFEQQVLGHWARLQEPAASSKSEKPSKLVLPPTLAVDLTGDKSARDRVITFLESHTDPRPSTVQVIPDWLVGVHNGTSSSNVPTVFLNIPMDQQTPQLRLLRPQAMIQEALIRNYVSTYCYRMDLTRARSDDPLERQSERDRFLRAIDPLVASGDLQLMITDSQAIDVVAPWTMIEPEGNDYNQELVPITTFSIAMIRYLSGGRLSYFVDGLRKLDDMILGTVTPANGGGGGGGPNGGKWRILISEACNHTRLNLEKECADIGTVQLPNHLTKVLGGPDRVDFEYAFGKHVTFDPTRYDLVVHCGGCMLSPQQMDSRVADLVAANVPATNYGLLLSRIQSPLTLSRVLKPWGIDYDYNDHHPDTHGTDPMEDHDILKQA